MPILRMEKREGKGIEGLTKGGYAGGEKMKRRKFYNMRSNGGGLKLLRNTFRAT